MAYDNTNADEHTIDTVSCPILGDLVTVTAAYRHVDDNTRALVSFGCNMEGECGITPWDPCPMYTEYRERRNRRPA